ncbi:MAG: UDP-N-acetylmuramoyl-tripeptide--D-alanyl-D-alanine ligase [Phycisphaeraceae bacterium]
MPSNATTGTSKRFWQLGSLAERAGGRWLSAPSDANAAASTEAIGMSIDTRTLRAGEVFLAIRGERFDGHDYVKQALAECGAAAAVVDRIDFDAASVAGPVLLVDDAVAALQRWASAWREELARAGCRVIAVAGSNGKTTTRQLIHRVLTHAGLEGSQSPRSFNNHLGVPLSLLAASPNHAFVVIEIGTNHPGEVAALAKLVRPDAAVVVSLGREHLEHFGGVEAVEREELSLLDFVRKGGPSWTPHDPPPAYRGELGIAGAHNRSNAAYAAAVGRWMGCDDASIEQALATAEPPPGRGVVREIAGVTILDDSYNANPDSMLAALDVLRNREATRRVAVLGDMFELGDHTAAGHDEVLAAAVRVADRVLAVGEAFSRAAEKAGEMPTVRAFASLDESSIAAIVDELDRGDAVLLKGSRGMAMERILAAVTAPLVEGSQTQTPAR